MTKGVVLGWLVIVAIALAPAGLAAGPAEFMPLSEVRPGMRGEARTVVHGTTVERFDVEVLSVVPGSGPVGDLILIRASGPVIQRTGGIAAGMSGSPVYLQGRLAGAIGFGWAFSEHSLGLVTPIAYMLRALPGARAGADRAVAHQASGDDRILPSPVTVGGRTITRVAIAPSAGVAATTATRTPGVAVMVPLARPLLVSGMSPRVLQLLRGELDPLGLTLVEGAAGASTDARPTLVPGSAVGVQLMRGDLNAVAIGTLTYRQGDAIVAFGHPLLNRGSTGYLLTPAVIHEVVRSTAFPFKVGSAGAPVGIVTEDRRAAIGGRIGVLPPLVAVRVSVTDRDRGRTAMMGTRVINDRQLGPLLAVAAAMEAVDRVLDRIGEGTAHVRLTLRARGLAGPVVRENTFYHARDIGSAGLLELPEALRLLFANEFVETGPVDVLVEAEIERTRQTASITEATVDTPRVRRGGTVVVGAILRPFQGPAITRTIDVRVPEGFPAGPATVLVRAGGRPMPEQGLAALLAAEPTESPAASMSAQLAGFSERDRNTDLIVELIPGAARIPGGAGDQTVQTVRVRTATSWVVRGRTQLAVTVDPQ